LYLQKNLLTFAVDYVVKLGFPTIKLIGLADSRETIKYRNYPFNEKHINKITV